MSDALSVYACDPQPIVLEGLCRVLATRFTGGSTTLSAGLEAIRVLHPRVVLIDYSFGVNATMQFIADLKICSPGSRAVLWIVDYNENDCFRALQLGARGVLMKTLPVASLLDCLETVCRGRIWVDNPEKVTVPANVEPLAETSRLTRREQEIVSFVCKGFTNREIAAELGITAGTVKVHLMHVFEKVGVTDRRDLVKSLRPSDRYERGVPIDRLSRSRLE